MIKEFKETYHEIAERKRAEFEAALARGDVAEPISMTAILVSVAISASMAAASFLLTAALAPKPPRQERGRMSGSLQLQNSEQGIMIPEIYGAGPDVNIVAGSNPTYQNLTNTTAGADGSITKTSGADNNYNAGASHNVSVASGQDAFIKVTRGTGHAAAGFFDTASPTGSGGLGTGCIFGIAWSPDGTMYGVINGLGTVVGSASVLGDVFTIEIRNGRFHLYKGSAELDMNRPQPSPTFPIWMGVIMYSTGAGVSAAKVQIGSIGDAPNAGRGGIKLPAIIVYTSGIRKNVSVTTVPVQGGKGGSRTTQTVENITYDIDLRLNFGRGPLRLLREYANADIVIDQFAQSPNPSGVYNPAIPPDTTYDPNAPPNPEPDYSTPFLRVNGAITYDANGVGTGTIQGGGSLFAIYPGNETQDPDPTEEADIDAQYGAGSTPAHRSNAGIVHKQFSLSRWSGIVPNMTSVWEHETLKTYGDIFPSLCERVNVTAASDDYNFTGLADITCRGMLIAGRLFQPAEVMDSPEIQLAGNFFVTEVEGQIVGFAEGDEPELEIDDTEVGWLDGETDVPDIIPEVESILASEILLPRQIDVKFISPDSEWDTNTQSAKRQITDGVSTELLEVQLALLNEEARAMAQRALFRQYVAGTAHKFTLPWTYLYVHPGYKITINRAEGFTHTLRLTSITGGIGVLECEGIALEPSVFNQPAVGSIPPVYNPPQMIPAMTIMSLLDTPLLREGDITNNDGVGWYWVATPRTGSNQSWQGAVLYIFKNNQWIPIANSQLPGTIGTVVSVSDLYSDPDVVDIVFTVDSTTDIFTSTGHFLTDTDEVTVGNTGGALPAPLVAGTSYFVRDKTANTFKLAATSGGAAINITSNGTGTNFINVGKIVVDLYGTTQTLSSVAKADMLTGANLALAGGMLFNFADATQVADFPNRWTLTTLLTGQEETDEFTADVAVGDRFVLINEAVKFVPMDEADLNNEMEYRTVTVGQSLDDAATILATWFGATMRERKVTNLNAVRDLSGNWLVSATGHPRQLPAHYNLRVRRPLDDVLMRDIPIAIGTTLPSVFGDTFGNILVTNNNLATGPAKTFTAVAATDVITAVGNQFPDGHKVRVSNTGGALPAPLLVDTDYFIRDKVGDTFKLAATLGGAVIDLTTDGTGTNSIRTAPFVVSGVRTNQEITEPGAFLEFVLPALNTLAGGSLNLALFHSDDAGWTDTSAWTLGVYTIRFAPKNVTTGEWGVYFYDVGGESAGQVLLENVSLGLGAMKIRLTFMGTELRVYKNWASSSTQPLVISKVPPAEHFPMKAAFYLTTGAVNNDAARIEQVVIGGMVNPSTVYSKTQQNFDDPVTDMASIDVEMWQVSTVEGRKVRKEFP